MFCIICDLFIDIVTLVVSATQIACDVMCVQDHVIQ